MESATQSHMKVQQSNGMPFCVRRYWWLVVFFVVAIVFLGIMAFNYLKAAPENKSKKVTTAAEGKPELRSVLENAHLKGSEVKDAQQTTPILTQSVKSKQSQEDAKQQINALNSAQAAAIPAVLRTTYQTLSAHLNKIVTDSYGNKYVIKNIYLRDFKEYTYAKQTRFVFL